MEAIKYPVKYNREDNILEDSSGMTIALLAWPNCMLPIELVDARGEELVRVVNAGKANGMIDYAMSKPEVTNVTKQVTIVEKTANFVSSMVDAMKGVGKVKRVGSVRVYRKADGELVELVGRGRPCKGWERVK